MIFSSFIFYLNLFTFNWRMIALQYCIGFCHISTWIGHRHMYIYFPSSLHNSLSFKSNTLTRMCLRLLHGSAFLVYSVSESLNSVLPSHWETLRLSHRWILFWSIVGSLTETIVLLHWTVFVFVPLVAQQLKRLPGMQETQVQSLGREDPLEKEMAPHSSILAWGIPWREEPGRLQSTGSQRVGHDWATSLHFTSPYLLSSFP